MWDSWDNLQIDYAVLIAASLYRNEVQKEAKKPKYSIGGLLGMMGSNNG